MAGLTRALVARHALGRAEAYDAALLDVAQDHLLYLLSQTVQFGDNRLVFKGGTSLRKCRLGNVGRFSTDLDFSAPDDEVVLEVCELIDGALLKVWGDVVDDRRGTRPLRVEDVLAARSEHDFQPDSIGVLTRPVAMAAWEARVRKRFAFLTDLDADEQRWAACDERHRREVENALAVLRS